MPNRQLQRIDIDEVTDWASLAEEVRATNEPRILQKESQDVAVLMPMSHDTVKRARRSQPFTLEDPLWEIAGIGQSQGPTDVSANKHKYIAEAYVDLHASPAE